MTGDVRGGIVKLAMLLELRGVNKIYENEGPAVLALDDVSCSVAAGECVALYGSNRSGKSSLLRIAVGVERPTEGTVTYRGTDMSRLDAVERSRLLRFDIAWVPSSPEYEPGLCVLDLVAFAAYVRIRDFAEAERWARVTLKQAGIERRAGARPSKLTDGELRLLAIAQATVKRPRLLIADNPASELDPIERDRVLALLRACTDENGTGVLFSGSHAGETLRATTLLRMDRGRLSIPAVSPGAEVIPLPARGYPDEQARQTGSPEGDPRA